MHIFYIIKIDINNNNIIIYMNKYKIIMKNFYEKKYDKPVAISIMTLWGTLGFNRGCQNYNYYYNKNNNKNNINNQYLYIDKFSSSILFSFFYINPIFMPFIIYKEIYRL